MKKIISFLLSIILLSLNQSCENDLNNCVFDDEIDGLENALNTYIADASASNCYRLKSAAITLHNATKECSEYTAAYDKQTLQAWQELDCTDSGGGNNNPGGSGGTGGSGNNGSEKGRAVFWTNYLGGQLANNGVYVTDQIEIKIGDISARLLGSLSSTPTECPVLSSPLAMQSIEFPVGTHTYHAYSRKREWTGTFTVYANGCTKVLINNK